MKVVIIGTGRIACGFVGQMLRASEHDVVFLARNSQLAENFNHLGHYRVELVSKEISREIIVDKIRAVNVSDTEKAAKEIASADMVATSIGCDNLPDIAKLLARGLILRKTPLNIVAFENMDHAGLKLRELVIPHLPYAFPIKMHGFAGAIVYRSVSRRDWNGEINKPLLFVGDSETRFYVDASGLRCALPTAQGMVVADGFDQWMQKQFSLFSAAHVTTAYLGHLKGYTDIYNAVRDSEIKSLVMKVLREGQQGLSACYGPELAGSENECLKIIDRLSNPKLHDPVNRVGRQPSRKIRPEERLVNTARLAEAAGLEPTSLATSIAAAMCFYNRNDNSSIVLHKHLDTYGLDQTLHIYSGLDTKTKRGRSVAASWNKLHNGWKAGTNLKSLEALL